MMTSLIVLLFTYFTVCPNLYSQGKKGFSVQPEAKDFSQPGKVFIATTSKYAGGATKEAILLYLEEAMNDTTGDLLVEVHYDCHTFDKIWGQIDYPPKNKTFYFDAVWKITTKGSGYFFTAISRDDYLKNRNEGYNGYNDCNED